MNESKKAKELIALLEKITGKKVIVEYPETAEAPTLSNRQRGAQQMIITKDQDDWTENQYALAYFIARYGKGKLALPYNGMTMDQIADDAGVKKSSLAMCISRCKFMLGQEGLETGGPKIETYFNKFAEMKPEEVSSLALKGLTDDTKPGKDVNGHKYADTAVSKPVITRNDISPEQLVKINASRAINNQPPLRLRAGKLVSEKVKKNGFILIENIIDTVESSDRDSKLIERIIKEADGNTKHEKLLAESVVSKITNPIDLLTKYKTARSVNSNVIAETFYNKAKEIIKANIVAEAITKLNKLTGKDVVLEESDNKIDESALNEWFAQNAYSKLLKLLDRAVKQVDSLHLSMALHHDKWRGIEKAPTEVKAALQSVFTNLTTGNQQIGAKKSMFDKIKAFADRDGQVANPAFPRLAQESEVKDGDQLNEMFPHSEYKSFLNILKRCADQASKVNVIMAKNPNKLEVDAKAILGKLKSIWKTFHLTAASGDAVTYAGDDINKLSAKPFAKKTQELKAAHAAEQAAKPEKKDKEPLSKRIINGIGKFFNKEGQEVDETGNILNENINALNEFLASGKEEINEIFGLSKREKAEAELKSKIEKAALEAKGYSILRLVGQPGGSTPEESNENMRTIVGIRIKEAMEQMPTLAELIPNWFELKKDSTNAARVNYKGHDSIIPSNFYFITNGSHKVDENSQKTFLSYVGRELKELARKHNIEVKL